MFKPLYAVLLAAVLITAACASDGPGHGPQGQQRADGGPPHRSGPRGAGPDGGADDDGPGGRRAALLFISPSGEPFRGRPGEPYPVAAWFAQADRNGDGRLDQGEFLADAERFFHVLDQDHDGVVDGLEVHAYETHMVPEIVEAIDRIGAIATPSLLQRVSDQDGPGGGGPGGGGGGRHRRRGGGGGAPQGGAPQGPRLTGAAPYGLLAEPEPVAASDLDFSGRITLDTFRRRAAQRFATLDAMGQGYLVLADLPKTAVQKQAGRRSRGSGGPPRPPA